MPPRMQRRRLPQLQSKVSRCTSVDQLQAIIDNAGDRLVFVHFTALWNPTCKKMAAFLAELSRKPEYSRVRFVEVDVQQVPDVVKAMGVKGLPGVQCYKAGECLENTVHNTPLQVLEALAKHNAKPPAGPTPWWARALQVLAAGALAAAAWAALGALSGGGDKARDELAKLDERIAAVRVVAQYNGKRSGGDGGGRRRSKKEVRAAQKQLASLLERREQLVAVAAASSASASPSSSSKKGGSRSGRRSRRSRGAAAADGGDSDAERGVDTGVSGFWGDADDDDDDDDDEVAEERATYGSDDDDDDDDEEAAQEKRRRRQAKAGRARKRSGGSRRRAGGDDGEDSDARASKGSSKGSGSGSRRRAVSAMAQTALDSDEEYTL